MEKKGNRELCAPCRYAQGVKHMVLNSGLFYVKANERTVALMQRIATRLRKEQAWDQSVWNQGSYCFTLSLCRVVIRILIAMVAAIKNKSLNCQGCFCPEKIQLDSFFFFLSSRRDFLP